MLVSKIVLKINTFPNIVLKSEIEYRDNTTTEVTREAQRGVSHPLLLLLGVGEQLADVGLGLAHVLVEDLGAVDDLWFAGVEHLADLPGHQRFTTARGPEEQDTLHVLTPWSDGAAQREREKRRKDAEGHRDSR